MTLAGAANSGAGGSGHADGTGDVARFYFPLGVTISPVTGVVYVADSDNHVIRAMTCTSIPVPPAPANNGGGAAGLGPAVIGDLSIGALALIAIAALAVLGGVGMTLRGCGKCGAARAQAAGVVGEWGARHTAAVAPPA